MLCERGMRQTILTLHGIGTPPSHVPASEKPYWISWRVFDGLLSLLAAREDHPPVLLTFDDGNLSDLAAAKKLKPRGLNAKFFLLTGRFGSEYSLSRDDAREIDSMGFEIGLHGRGHVDWRVASDAELAAETVDARAELAEAIGKPVTSVAIPFGAYNRRVITCLVSQNFDHIYISDPGPARVDHLFQRRTAIMAHHSMDDVAAITDDRVKAFSRVRRTLAPIVKQWR